MLPTEIKDLVKRGEALLLERDSRWQNVWDKVFRYEAPHRQRQEIASDGDDMFAHINDSTGMLGLSSFASFMLSGTTPAWMPWAMLTPGPDVTGDEREERLDQLADANKKLFLHINLSNYYQEAPIAMTDYAIGTGSLRIQPNENGKGFQFKALPMEDMIFDDRSSGQVDYTWVKTKLPGREILARFGPDGNKNLDPTEHQSYFNLVTEKPDERRDLWIITVPTDDIDPLSTFKHVIVSQETGQDGILLDEKTMPFNVDTVFRYERPHNSPHGVGPGIFAYADVRYLNTIRGTALRNAALQLAGVFTGVDDGIFDPRTVKLEPGAIIPVMSNDQQNPTLSALPMGSSVELAQFEINTLRGDIERMFFMDQFSPAQGSKLTATEVLMKAKLISQRLGTAYGRLQVEFLIPLVKKMVSILQSQGEIDKDIKIDFQQTDVVLFSTLAQAQRLQESEGLIQWATLSAELAGNDAGTAMVPDKPQIVRNLAELMQIDRSVIRSPKEVKEMLENAAKQSAELTQQLSGGVPGGETGFAPPTIPGAIG